MELGALSLFKRTSNKSTVNIAAYHSRHSLTWSWILSVSFDGIWRKPSGGLRFGVHPYRDNGGLQVVVTLPFLIFHRHRQREMWFRDLHRRAADERDDLSTRVRRQGRLLAFFASRTTPETPHD
jgi:hypothetical protein